MSPKRIHLCIVAGARPNFMKIAPIIRAVERQAEVFDYRLVHTGQHYDRDMSDVFFEELEIPKPHYHLDVGSGSHAVQTAKIMMRFEEVCLEARPDVVLVVGDVNSTLACSIVAKKLGIAVAHVEAGLRSGDMAMPEEVNRMVTDAISDFFFVTEQSGVSNLEREGHAAASIHFVGHVMIDNLFHQLDKLAHMDTGAFPTADFKRRHVRYGVVTLHRPSNVDDPAALAGIVAGLTAIAAELPLIFPIHPRTQARIREFGLELPAAVEMVTPLPFMEFLNLWKDASCVLTDSGGLQEETTAVGVPCLTLRANTERPVTLDEGSNQLVGNDPARMIAAARAALASGRSDSFRRPALWDGQAAERIVSILERELTKGGV
ncbi:MAG: UDP-N-acetylglucosamine 2-epimerase (non-hydrolyzing) [Gammaproteobacteria bacterium]|nr:UDP-N-acetylglucosamine 2-epimerase (non-hydrolyzing) [Gammaproteobacteria bacterium]